MSERRESLNEKFEVLFIIYNKSKKRLQIEVNPKDPFLEHYIVPRFKVEKGQTYESALKCGVKEKYDIDIKEFESIGVLRDYDNRDGYVYFRRVFLVGFEGKLSNPMKINRHETTSLRKAKEMCIDFFSKRALELFEDYLSR